jgi:hypothetical protein
MQPHPWYLLHSGPGNPAFNMALDEALLHAAPRLGRPVLRFYGWTEPAASFGYFQKYAVIESLTPLRPLVRRPTGGGLVPHDADWTYSLAFPPIHPWYSLSAIESYRAVHEWICAAFGALGVATKVAPVCRKALPGQCFQGHEQYDLLYRGQKLAGAAQRRTRDGLLIQGSVQSQRLALNKGNIQHPMRGPTAPAGGSRLDWEQAMCAAGRSAQGAQWTEFTPDAPLAEHALALARQKYVQAAYNQKR